MRTACPPAPPLGVHDVRVQLAQHDKATFLALVSTLHTRGVEVVAAELEPARGTSPTFTATFVATDRQAANVAASLRNRIDVAEAELYSPVVSVQDRTLRGPLLRTQAEEPA